MGVHLRLRTSCGGTFFLPGQETRQRVRIAQEGIEPATGVLMEREDICLLWKALRSAGGIRRPLRLLRKEKWCEAEGGP